MKNLFLAAMLAIAVSANAQTSATISCANGAGSPPVLQLSYYPGSDAGQPGMFWVALSDPNTRQIINLTQDNTFHAWTGGLNAPAGIYYNGLPGTINVAASATDSNGSPVLDVTPYAGWTVSAGHGVYTSAAQALTAARRASLNALKPQYLAAGKPWPAAYDDDTQFIWAAIQKDMADNNRVYAVMTAPTLDCTPVGNVVSW